MSNKESYSGEGITPGEHRRMVKEKGSDLTQRPIYNHSGGDPLYRPSPDQPNLANHPNIAMHDVEDDAEFMGMVTEEARRIVDADTEQVRQNIDANK